MKTLAVILTLYILLSVAVHFGHSAKEVVSETVSKRNVTLEQIN